MSFLRTTYRRTAATLGILALAWLPTTTSLAAEPQAHGGLATENGSASGSQFETTADLMGASGLSGTVSTSGDEAPGDGSGMRYSISTTLPEGSAGDISVPLADGRWAVPQGLPTSAPRSSDAAAAEDLITRATTFYDAGSQLIWDSSRTTPLTGDVVHDVTSAPYGITCSTFVSMVLLGWDYEHTTYVADQNTQVGYAVDFGVEPETSKLWRANNLASWFYGNGDLWLETDGNYERGDILFFSEQDPEGRGEQVRSGKEDTYFGNVYHAAIYLGDGMLIHSTGVGDGVNITGMSSELEAELSFVARPQYVPSAGAEVEEPAVQVETEAPVEAPVEADPIIPAEAPIAEQPAVALESRSGGAVVAQPERPERSVRSGFGVGVAAPTAAVALPLLGLGAAALAARRRKAAKMGF